MAPPIKTEEKDPQVSEISENSQVVSDSLTEPLLSRGRKDGEASKNIVSTKGKNVCAYENANIVSLLLFTWMSPLFTFGSKNTIQSHDIPPMSERDSAKTSFLRFDAVWRAQQERVGRERAERGEEEKEKKGKEGETQTQEIKKGERENGVRGKGDGRKGEGEKGEGEKKGEGGSERGQSVTWALWDAFKSEIIITGLIALARSSIMYSGPALLSVFVSYAEGERTFLYEGGVLVAALFLTKLTETALDHQYNFRSTILALSVRSSITGALYQKILRLSSKARQSRTQGEVVNLMSSDAQRLAEIVVELHNIWVIPVQIILALIILFLVVGWAFLAGLGVMLAIMLLNLLVATKQQQFMVGIMDARDKRMKTTTEVLNSMRIIKLYGWQETYQKKVQSLRDVEYGQLSNLLYIGSLNIFLLWLSPLAVSVATFGCMILLNYELTPGKVFTAIATFRILQEPLRSFPSVISAVQQALVSLKRLTEFLVAEELQDGSVLRIPASGSPEVAVSVDRADFGWDSEAKTPLLKNLSFEVLRGSRVAICGAVGSGKSSILSALFGEMFRQKGTAFIRGSIAYVPQVAWIQNGTIRENILFGLPLDEARYRTVIECTLLVKDLSLFSHGDATEIGERGINLSGGQKQRIQLARAVYQNSDVYLLDDPFSAVDAHTGTEIFEKCIMEALADKTVVLVTHQVEFLPATDLILVLRDGEIVQQGQYSNLLASGTDFLSLINAHTEAMDLVDEAKSGGEKAGGKKGEDGQEKSSKASVVPEKSLEDKGEESEKMKEGGQLIADEERESGRVGRDVYVAFLTKALHGVHIPVLVLIQFLWQCLQIGSDWWLQYFTSPPPSAPAISNARFMQIYTLLALGSALFVLARSLVVSWAGLETAQVFYRGMLNSIFRAPMAFFDSTPIGRILSRSSTNQASIDIDMPFTYGSLLAILFALLGVLFVTSLVTWPIIIAIAFMAYLYFMIQEYYLATSREISRVDGLTKAPMIQNFSESIAGAPIIRAFAMEAQFKERNESRVDTNTKSSFYYYTGSDWLGTRLEIIGASLLTLNALLLLLLPASMISPGLVGLSLSYSLALNQMLYWVIWIWCHIENEMVGVERILQYSHVTPEKPLYSQNPPPASWPDTGAIKFKDLQVRYRPDLPLVLRDVTLSVKGGQKVGVVGRTGSGKSTLVQVLFRIIEPPIGTITVDGIDISVIGLNELRRQLSIIPQEPILFEGTIRENLDPMGFYRDEDIWTALEKCQLAEEVKSKGSGLDSPVSENGENYSVGQRQLLCLGRALLKKSKILVLDEATASVDSKTDQTIQKTIKDNFRSTTVISIAHRIPTVIDSDMVLVMDDGKVAEYDSPANLLESKNSLFSRLVSEYSARSSGFSEKARNSSVEKL